MVEAAVSGFLVALSLIVAIGAQNALVLRQGLRREHVGWVVLLCAGSDAILIAAGVAGFGTLAARWPWAMQAMLWAGALFLFVYGALRFRAAWQGGGALQAAQAAPAPLGAVIGTVLLLTWANPHVYLDTVVLIGSVSARHAPFGLAFGIGAVLASFSFFASLGYGARYLAPVFARPRAWVALEAGIGVVMWAIAVKLVAGA